jgi:hypothetical protein
MLPNRIGVGRGLLRRFHEERGMKMAQTESSAAGKRKNEKRRKEKLSRRRSSVDCLIDPTPKICIDSKLSS